MTMAYIRKKYGVPAKRGMRVRYTGASVIPVEGTITSSRAGHIVVRFDRWPFPARVALHPTWMVEYLT